MTYPPPRRLWVQLISKVSFRAIFEHGDWTVRKLAAKTGVNRSTIGHLLSPAGRDTCLSSNAKAIAKGLGVPVDALFRAQLSPVSSDISQRRRAA